jgi:hypothetical protein
MKDQETVQKFIELRAQGWSFARIAAASRFHTDFHTDFGPIFPPPKPAPRLAA